MSWSSGCENGSNADGKPRKIDEGTGELRLALSNGSRLDVIPGRHEASDDPPYWELNTPEGLMLEFGPGLRWQISGADVRVSLRI